MNKSVCKLLAMDDRLVIEVRVRVSHWEYLTVSEDGVTTVCAFSLCSTRIFLIASHIFLGVDPSLFSQSLMHFASKHAATSWAGEPDYDPIEETAELGKSDITLSPVEIIARAYQNVLDEPAVQCGEKILASAASSVCYHSAHCRSQGQARRVS